MAVAVSGEGCSGTHTGGTGQVRGITGARALGPAADIAIMSSTEATMAATAVQPSVRVLILGPAGRPGSLAGGAAGEPVVALVKPVSTLPAPVCRSRSPNSARHPEATPKWSLTCLALPELTLSLPARRGPYNVHAAPSRQPLRDCDQSGRRQRRSGYGYDDRYPSSAAPCAPVPRGAPVVSASASSLPGRDLSPRATRRP